MDAIIGGEETLPQATVGAYPIFGSNSEPVMQVPDMSSIGVHIDPVHFSLLVVHQQTSCH